MNISASVQLIFYVYDLNFVKNLYVIFTPHSFTK